MIIKYNFLREMSAMFGSSFWNVTIFEATWWPYDSGSIQKRNYTGKDEEWFLSEWNQQFKEKLHLEHDLDGVFIDSYSQQPWNLNDQLQQEAFQVIFNLFFFYSIFEIIHFREKQKNFGNLLQRINFIPSKLLKMC